MKKRWDAASKFVVFHDILVPLVWSATKPQAFALILEQCGYEPIWSEGKAQMTLRFRSKDSTELAAECFVRDLRSGPVLTRETLMSDACEAGLRGWRTLPRDSFAIQHGIAERTIHTVWNRPRWRYEA